MVAHFLPIRTPEASQTWQNPGEEQNCMVKPMLDHTLADDKDLYAFIGRVSLLLVEHNVDAITATTFLREIAEAGGGALSLEQARRIAQNYVDMPHSRHADTEP
jgi:hypothetical protein